MAKGRGKGPYEKGEARPKRDTLRNDERLPSVALYPEGVSPVRDCSLCDLWNYAQEGGRATTMHSEWCSKEGYRRGIGLSRLCESLLSAAAELEAENVKFVVQPAIHAKAMEEFNTIKDALKVLNGGKATESGGRVTLYSMKAKQMSSTGPSADAIATAAETIYDWLKLPKTPLRALLAILSSGGPFYAAAVNEKMARAAISTEGGNYALQDVVEAAKARRLSGGASSKPPETMASMRACLQE